MSVVESRYAEALLDAAAAPRTADDIGAVLDEFSAMMSSQGNIRDFMLDPTIPAAAKKEAAAKLLPEKASPFVKNFMCLLIDKSRLELLPGICKAYGRMKAERQNCPDILVYSAQLLDEIQLMDIRDKYRKQYNVPSARVYHQTDPSLIGGILVQIGDVRIDGTLLGRINGLRSSLERK